MECFTLIHLIFVILFAPLVYGFSIPKVNVKLLKPKGIQFSLKEMNDVVYSDVKIFIFASKGLINNLKFVESDLKRDDNGLWTFQTTNADLKIDDSIEYWLYIEHNKFGSYLNDILKIEDIEQLQAEQKASIRSTTSTSVVNGIYPHINVKLLTPNDIRFSIEDDSLNNVKLIVLASKAIRNNSKLIEVPFSRTDNGIWNYELVNTSLKADDAIEYWLYAEKNGVGYFSSDIIKLQDIEPVDYNLLHRNIEVSSTNETYPYVSVQMIGTDELRFSIQEDSENTFNDVKILIFSPKSIINNLKFIEYQLSRDDGGLWIYEMQNLALIYDEVVEYWIYVEKPNVAYFTSQIFKVQDIAPPPTTTTTTTPTSLTLLDLKVTTASTTTMMPTTTTQSSKGCESSVSTVNGKSVGCKNSIIFNEDFNSDNLKYWSFDTRFPLDDATADAEFTLYEKRNETSYIRDGTMFLKAESLKRITGFDDTRIRIGSYNLKERCTPISNDNRECERQAQFGYILPPVTSAYLTTRNKFSFMYGRIEARVRAPIGDYLYAQITLQPQQSRAEIEASNSSSQHLKVFFVRGNENLKYDDEEVGGSRIYGGAILSKNPKNNLKWLKSKHSPSSHFGNDFHIVELLWTSSEISLSLDGKKYGSLSSNLRESAMVAKIKSAVNWAANGPFDKEHFISINLAAGSVKNFYSHNSTILNGIKLESKPWNDTDPKAEKSFYLAHDKWYPTWKKPSLDVDYIKIYAV